MLLSLGGCSLFPSRVGLRTYQHPRRISVTFFLATLLLFIYNIPRFISHQRKYFLGTKLLFTSVIQLDYLHSTNLFTCTGMFVVMATVEASPHLAECWRKWNNLYSPLCRLDKVCYNLDDVYELHWKCYSLPE
jgi:hypothetical protein